MCLRFQAGGPLFRERERQRASRRRARLLEAVIRHHRQGDTHKADKRFGLELKEDVEVGGTELGVARVARVPEATGAGELAQGKVLSTGQGLGFAGGICNKRKRLTERIEKSEKPGRRGKEEGVLTAAERTGRLRPEQHWA